MSFICKLWARFHMGEMVVIRKEEKILQIHWPGEELCDTSFLPASFRGSVHTRVFWAGCSDLGSPALTQPLLCSLLMVIVARPQALIWFRK